MKQYLKRYRFLIITIVGLIIMSVWDLAHAIKTVEVLAFSLKEMLLVIPPIFILLGLLDVWVPKEAMIRFMGDGSGIRGAVLAVLVGSAAAGPLYGAFPVAAVFMKKGVSFYNILIFIGAWSTTKIPMFLFELTALGPKFAWTRLAVNIPGIIIIAWVLNNLVNLEEKKVIYEKAESF